MSKRRGLGRGLDALLAGSQEPQQPIAPVEAQDRSAPAAGLAEVPIERIFRSRFQPRRQFDEQALEDLAQSIRSQGLMQPIVLRQRAAGGYELVAGERRWRAAQLAGLSAVPAVVKEVDDQQAMAMALIENIQREDLNPLEEALAMQRLRDEFQLTQQQFAEALGKSRVAVANTLRLTNLAPGARALLERGELEMGHARALLGLEPGRQDALAREVVERRMTVRDVEGRVRNLSDPSRRRRPERIKDPDTRRLEQRLSEQLGAPVSIETAAGGKGRLVVSYSSHEELDGILAHLR